MTSMMINQMATAGMMHPGFGQSQTGVDPVSMIQQMMQALLSVGQQQGPCQCGGGGCGGGCAGCQQNAAQTSGTLGF